MTFLVIFKFNNMLLNGFKILCLPITDIVDKLSISYLTTMSHGFNAAKIPDEDRLNELKDNFRNVDREHKIRSELSDLKHKLGLLAEVGLKENSKRETICRKIVKLSEAIPLAIRDTFKDLEQQKNKQ
ncbi:hypothetical protein BpHYR1_030890 [Brachionus plicatilis]|uniref:Uncharacterized protein n=1 Tax=Brachionus plicatilis TaxID=10195 RepID=A0A3M7PEV8_BRAPC|nr:hypothetical protein BpHYR1_030890 [Brachionus plicatilis]